MRYGIPAAQVEHATAPVAEYVPARHCTGATAGSVHWLPARHGVHETAPGLSAYWPKYGAEHLVVLESLDFLLGMLPNLFTG